MRMLGNGKQRRDDIKTGAVGQMKDADEIDRIAGKHVMTRHFQPARPNGEPINLFAAETGRQARCGARLYVPLKEAQKIAVKSPTFLATRK